MPEGSPPPNGVVDDVADDVADDVVDDVASISLSMRGLVEEEAAIEAMRGQLCDLQELT